CPAPRGRAPPRTWARPAEPPRAPRPARRRRWPRPAWPTGSAWSSPSSGSGRLLAGLPGIEALAVDRRHLGAHRAQVHRELPAVMDGVALADLEIQDGRELEDAAGVDHSHQLLAAR